MNYMITTFTKLILSILPILIVSQAFAQSDPHTHCEKIQGVENAMKCGWQGGEDKQSKWENLPPPPTLDPKRSDDPEYVAEMLWEHLRYNSKEEAIENLKLQKETVEKMGFKWNPPQPGDPNYVSDYFTIPENESLDDCTYVRGYSFPDVCQDEKGNVIFKASVDGQEVLDKIAKKQGRFGKYNKLPKKKDGKADIDDSAQ